jgi:hypothetical protein
MKRKIVMHSELSGRFRLKAYSAKTGRKTKDTGWFNNLILDQGLDLHGAHAITSILGWCRVGTSSTAPGATQTALGTQIAATSTKALVSQGNSGADPYYIYLRQRWTFAEGAAAGNLTEVGIGRGQSTELFSRALIVDSGGSPTTLTIAADEILRVEYEIRMHPPTTDASGNLTLDGVSTNWAIRAYSIDSYASNMSGAWTFRRDGRATYYMDNSAMWHKAGAQALLGLTEAITGHVSQQCYRTSDAYVPGSYEATATFSWTISIGNISGGIGMIIAAFGMGMWQVSFDPPIDKTADKTLTLYFRHSWGRKT